VGQRSGLNTAEKKISCPDTTVVELVARRYPNWAYVFPLIEAIKSGLKWPKIQAKKKGKVILRITNFDHRWLPHTTKTISSGLLSSP
jgi:hypothetical protein